MFVGIVFFAAAVALSMGDSLKGHFIVALIVSVVLWAKMEYGQNGPVSYRRTEYDGSGKVHCGKVITKHFIIMFVLTVGLLWGMIVWGFHTQFENTKSIPLSFFRVAICYPLIGWGLPKIAKILCPILMDKQIAACQQATLDEQRAALEAERKKQADIAEAQRKEREAAAEAERQKRAAIRAAEEKKLAENRQVFGDFWDLLIKAWVKSINAENEEAETIKFNVSINSGYSPESWVEANGPYVEYHGLDVRNIATTILNIYTALSEGDPPTVWVRNEDRITKMEEIMRASGLHFSDADKFFAYKDGKLKPNYPYESVLIEEILYKGDVLYSCTSRLGDAPFVGAILGEATIKIGDGSNEPPNIYTDPFTYNIRNFLLWTRGQINSRLMDYRKEYEIMKAGLKGEYAVQQILDMHAGAFIVMHDLRLEFPGNDSKMESVETDTLVLSPNGIFAIETKNYGESGRYKIIVTGDGNWYKEYPARYADEEPKRERMANPFAQNDRHIAFLERFINEVLGRDMGTWAHVQNIICIANDEVTLENDPSAKQTLTRTSNLYNQLTHDKTQKFTVDELNKVKAAFEARSLPGKKYPLPDYSGDLKALVGAFQDAVRIWWAAKQLGYDVIRDHPEFKTAIK